MQKKHHILLYLLLGLCVLLAVAYAWEAEREADVYAAALQDSYRGALMGALEQIEQLRLNIDKALLSQDEGQSAALLNKIGSDASAVQSGLSALPLSHAAMADAVKLCNQISDYANVLLTRASASIAKEDAALLQQLAQACDKLLEKLQSAYGQMQANRVNFDVTRPYMADADGAARPLEGAAEAIDYPTLIYDGPFSDVISEESPRGLAGTQISQEEAISKAKMYLPGVQNAVPTQESGGSIPAWGVRMEMKDCALQAAVTKQGGEILWMFPETAAFEARYGLEECKEAAQAFFAAHGYGPMKLTFWQIYAGMATLSYAAVQEGVLIYPDLVKVQVRMDTLEVVGLEARHYLSSHTERRDLRAQIDQEEAQGAVSERLQVENAQLCVIPQSGREYLCWEFKGQYAGNTYYVYIDAMTGRQRDIQRLVQTSSGPKAG